MDSAEARRIFRAKISEAVECFRVYGLDIYIPGSLLTIIAAAEELHEKLKAAEEAI